MITIKRDELSGLWESRNRVESVTTAMMLTTAQMENGVGDLDADGLSDRFRVDSTRVEQQQFLKPPGWLRQWCKRTRHQLTIDDCTSWGPFQLMGSTLCDLGTIYYEQIEHHKLLVAGQLDRDEYVLEAMNAYEKHFLRLLRSLEWNVPLAFERYNGNDARAKAYGRKAVRVWKKIQDSESKIEN